MPIIRTLQAVFNLDLKPADTRAFKGAWNEYFVWVNEKHHGHDNVNGGYLYQFPEVQFRSIGGKAAVMAINEEADAIMAFFDRKLETAFVLYRHDAAQKSNSFSPEKVPVIAEFSINGGEKSALTLACEPDYNACMVDFLPPGQTHTYIIRNYLPFPADDEEAFKKIKGLLDRDKRIQEKLTNHIKDFANAIGWKYDRNVRQFEATITNKQENKDKKRYNHQFLSYDIEFTCDLLLPAGIGIGPKKRLGHGVIEKL